MFLILSCNQEENASDLNKNGRLHKASYSKYNKMLVNENKLLEEEKATLTFFKSKHLPHT